MALPFESPFQAKAILEPSGEKAGEIELELHSGLAQLTGSKINFEGLETNQIGGSESLLHDSDTAIAQF